MNKTSLIALKHLGQNLWTAQLLGAFLVWFFLTLLQDFIPYDYYVLFAPLVQLSLTFFLVYRRVQKSGTKSEGEEVVYRILSERIVKIEDISYLEVFFRILAIFLLHFLISFWAQTL